MSQVEAYGHVIAGKAQTTNGASATTEVHNPATGQLIAHVPKGTPEDGDAAIDAARKAFANPDWAQMDPTERGRILRKLADLIRANLDELAALETANQGKPLREAKADIMYAAWTFDYYAGVTDKIQGDTIPVPGNRLNYTLRQPLGVTLHIAPWNFPFQLASRSVAPALATGNTVVLKPASLTPLTALRMGTLGSEAGLPAGVLNVVTGDGRTLGQHLVQHPHVEGVYLTGSVETGKQVMQSMGTKLKRFTLELGGKNPNIVFPDADIGQAVKGCALGAFMNAGQMCWAGSRVLVHEDIHDEFMQAFTDRVAGLKVGPGTDKATRLGPVVSAGQKKSVGEYVTIGQGEGAKLVTGGVKVEANGLAEGHFLPATVFDNVTSNMRIAREEIFGPVVSVMTYKDYADAIKIANDTEFGLYAGVWTKDLSTAHQAARDLQTGMVTINEYPVTFPQTPFASAKNSGLGVEQGLHALEHYTRLKNVNVRLG